MRIAVKFAYRLCLLQSYPFFQNVLRTSCNLHKSYSMKSYLKCIYLKLNILNGLFLKRRNIKIKFKLYNVSVVSHNYCNLISDICNFKWTTSRFWYDTLSYIPTGKRIVVLDVQYYIGRRIQHINIGINYVEIVVVLFVLCSHNLQSTFHRLFYLLYR